MEKKMKNLEIKTNIFKIILLCTAIMDVGHLKANPIPEEMTNFSRRSYNSLPFSKEANEKLQQNGNLSLFLKEAKKVAKKYDVKDSIGFRLLHRHESVKKGKVTLPVTFW